MPQKPFATQTFSIHEIALIHERFASLSTSTAQFTHQTTSDRSVALPLFSLSGHGLAPYYLTHDPVRFQIVSCPALELPTQALGHGLYHGAVRIIVFHGPCVGSAQTAGNFQIDVKHLQ